MLLKLYFALILVEFIVFSSTEISFTKYLQYDEINSYLNKLEKENYFVNIETFQKTYEGRDINITIISSNRTYIDRNVIFIDAGIIGADWISPAVSLYVIDQLVEHFKENNTIIPNFDWIILPLANPDGYVYSHTKQRDWRKNRKPNYNCIGVDLTRNFDFHWGEELQYKCTNNYQGPYQFSELETKVYQDIFQFHGSKCKFYLSLQQAGKSFLYPWGFTSLLPNNWADMDRIAHVGAGAIKQATGTSYNVGSLGNTSTHSGNNLDYAHGFISIPVTLTMELPYGKTNDYDIEPSQIKGVVEEAWIGIKAMAEEIIRNS